MNEFTPKVIGLPNTKKEKAIVEIYTEICENADALILLFEWFLSDQSDLKLFFDFLNSQKPRDFLYSRFIEIKQIQVPGLSLEKIIELELVDVPKDDFEELLSQRIQLLKSIQKTKEVNFYFPLSKLYYSLDDVVNGFEISYQYESEMAKSPEFDAELYKHVREFTCSEKENGILQAIEKATDSLNELVRLGIIRNDRQRWANDLNDFIHAIVFSMNEDNPLSINPNLPKLRGFGKHFEKRGWERIQRGPENILRFENKTSEPVGSINPGDTFNSEDSEAEYTEETPKEIIQTE